MEHPVIKRPYKLAPSADLVYSIKAKQRGIGLSGGKGGMRNVIVGALLIGIMQNAMTIMEDRKSVV